jgi:hypothetical protein
MAYRTTLAERHIEGAKINNHIPEAAAALPLLHG